MRARSLFVGLVFVVGVAICSLPSKKHAPQANPLAVMPFISGWNPFDVQVNEDEPEPTGSIIQRVCGTEIWVWDRPMSVYPETINTPDGVRICMSFPTPQSKGVRREWWSDDPRLKSREKHLTAKKFEGFPPDVVWHEITEIYNGQFSFIYCPKAPGPQVLRVVGMIDEAKESTSHPLPFWKMGNYAALLRGAQVRWNARSPFIPGTNLFEPCLLGIDGRPNTKRFCQTLFNEGAGGRPLMLNWRNEPGPNPNAVPVDRLPIDRPERRERERSEPENRESPQPTGDGLRWAVPVSHGRTMKVCLRWPDGSTSEPVEADGKQTVAIPEGMTSFQALVWDGKRWVVNYPLHNGRLQYDAQGRPVTSYPVPEKAGGRITFDVAELSREQTARGN